MATTPLNSVENNGSKIGIITGGVAYQYVKEVAPDLDYLRLGLSFPLPFKKIEAFIKAHDRVIVVEELEPFYEDQIKTHGLDVSGKEYFGRLGELSPHRVAEGLKKALGAVVTGDIGCYTLGVLEPLNALDSCVCMGASIGAAIGMEKIGGSDKGTVAVIGDSTFLHSGITGLIDAVYNKSHVTVMILDNRATAMTGGQQHPGQSRHGHDRRPAASRHRPDPDG
jgi:indolepyruvate ferredoxin oxidoreductase alpha subunit